MRRSHCANDHDDQHGVRAVFHTLNIKKKKGGGGLSRAKIAGIRVGMSCQRENEGTGLRIPVQVLLARQPVECMA